ncbi:helix-turn-helix domain-containing protein [Tahibacter amnicola]|uniref:helix-turn-helix domain-containing protein n=1 Tax=Tahibacter amnicola TaxID=2976241 RepID=UPI003CCD8C4D
MRRRESDFASPAVKAATNHLATLVRQARLARGWSQAELAEGARLSTPTPHRIEPARPAVWA